MNQWTKVTDIPEEDRGLALAFIYVHSLVAPGVSVRCSAEQIERLDRIGTDNYAANREAYDGMTLFDIGTVAVEMAAETERELAAHHPDIYAAIVRARKGVR